VRELERGTKNAVVLLVNSVVAPIEASQLVGEIGGAFKWAWQNPVEAIGIAASTVTLVLTLGADAPEVLAIDITLVETAEGTALTVDLTESVAESALLKFFSKVAFDSGIVGAARGCLYRRDTSACSWEIAGLLAGTGLRFSGATALQRAVFDWLTSIAGPFDAGDERGRPCAA
jgi:hypothetical protein